MQSRGPSNRKQKRHAQRLSQKTLAKSVIPALKRIMKSGAGLQADKLLREFLQEYNDRCLKHGPDSLPGLAAIMLDFFQHESQPDRIPLQLFPEQDHLFSLPDFLDYATSTDVIDDLGQAAGLVPEQVILNYSVANQPRDIGISVVSGEDAFPVSCSIIRRNNLVSMVLLAGIDSDIAQQYSISDDAGAIYNTEKPWLHSDELDICKSQLASTLESDDSLTRVIILIRYSLARDSFINRAIGIDCGQYYSVYTGVESVFQSPNVTERDVQLLLDRADSVFTDFSGLFELCVTSLYLPQYFAFKYQLVRDRVVPTQLAPARTRMSQPDSSPTPQRKHDGSQYKRVSAIEIVDTGATPAARRYAAPTYRVEVVGFWRSLKSGHEGKGPDGLPVQGKTWVKPHSRWNDRPQKHRQILVKSRLSVARELIRQEAAIQGDSPIYLECDTQVTREQAYCERKKLTSALRYKILSRDDFRCVLCGVDAASDPSVRLEVDHIVPIAKGGRTVLANLQALCNNCNRGKGASDPHEIPSQ